MESVLNSSSYHETRFTFDQRREIVWRTLCSSYFNSLVSPDDHVLELGAGYGHFINNVRCGTKTAIDQWAGLLEFLKPDVEGHVGSVTDLDFLPDRSIDFVFASNLSEHLTQPDFETTLLQLKRKLRPGGSLNILQPNYRRAYREYFDDYTHVSIYSDVSMCDFLSANGFRVIQSIPGFLPFSIKASKGKTPPWLIDLYLRSPWKPFAKQMFIRAEVQDR
ncbi:MAG: class I SAM-dependent methyltransferase [Acidobacteriota bacterium]|nr:class I SAM-dependent methyltransferase [Acidobacteriota bacterium]